MKYKKLFELASKVLKQYGKDDGIKRCELKPCLDALSSGDFSTLTPAELFILWDSLGTSDRDEVTDALYNFVGTLWMHRQAKK